MGKESNITLKEMLSIERESLIRRLEDYIEFAEARKCFSDVGFYNDLLKYIKTKGEIKDHVISAMVNELTEAVPAYANAQCLRGAISGIVVKNLKGN